MNDQKNMDNISKGVKKPKYEQLILRFFHALNYFEKNIFKSPCYNCLKQRKGGSRHVRWE